MFDRIDHVGIAVEEIDSALELWRDGFQLDVGENHIELLAPLGPDTPVGKFLAKRGPGLHHVAYQVPDIDAALSAIAESGVPLIDKQPRSGIGGTRVAFLQPKGTGRVLTEIVEPAAGAH